MRITISISDELGKRVRECARKGKHTYVMFLGILVLFSVSYRFPRVADLNSIAKIYVVDSLLIRSIPYQAIHLFDFHNPREVTLVAELAIEGNVDVAVRSGILYADQYENLLVIDIGNAAAPVILDTIHNVFQQYQLPPNPLPIDEVVTVGCGCSSHDHSLIAPNTGGVGTGGSLARFTIVGNHLFCIDRFSLMVFDISDPPHPQFKNRVDVAWDIETVYGYGDYLFIGGQQGMYVYDIRQPDNPRQLSQFTHARSCDPVVVEDQRAYITLRSGGPCGETTNRLIIVDISSIESPQLLAEVPLEEPYGLAVHQQILFVCDGHAGLKILDAVDPGNVSEIARLTDLRPFDAIHYGTLLFVTAADGLYLFDVGDVAQPRLLYRIVA